MEAIMGGGALWEGTAGREGRERESVVLGDGRDGCKLGGEASVWEGLREGRGGEEGEPPMVPVVRGESWGVGAVSVIVGVVVRASWIVGVVVRAFWIVGVVVRAFWSGLSRI
jgi:hypothetical protein